MSTFRDRIRTVVAQEARPWHKFGHQVRLYELTRQVGVGLSYDDDVVFAAVWLHDLGVFEGNRPADLLQLQRWNHVEYAIERSNVLLTAVDFPSEKITTVTTVIREHQPQDNPSSLESVIVRDADMLEQLGSVAILRTAAKLGSDTRFSRFADVIGHLRHQLAALPDRMVLDSSKMLALSRQELLQHFLAQIEREGVGEDS